MSVPRFNFYLGYKLVLFTQRTKYFLVLIFCTNFVGLKFDFESDFQLNTLKL